MAFRVRLFPIATALVLASARLSAEPVPDSPPLLLGLLLPPEEAEAASVRHGVRLGVEHANDAPGPKAGLSIRGRVGQWGADADEAARMVLDDGVKGLIAPPGGAPTHLVLQVSGRTATPVVSLCPDSSVTGAGIPWLVRIVPSNLDEAGAIFSGLKRTELNRALRWAALVPDERAGRETANDLQHAAEAMGCQLEKPVRVPTQPADLASAIRAVLATQPDVVLLWLDPGPAGRAAKSLRAAGFVGTLAGPGRLRSAACRAAAGSALDGAVVPGIVMNHASEAVFARFAAAYRARFGGEPDPTATFAYDAARLLVDLLRKAGHEPPHRAFPVATDLAGASGGLSFDHNGHRDVALRLLVCRGGRFTPLVTETAKP